MFEYNSFLLDTYFHKSEHKFYPDGTYEKDTWGIDIVTDFDVSAGAPDNAITTNASWTPVEVFNSYTACDRDITLQLLT